ncbi:MAG TPA: hypothetical protein VEC58_00420 [Roseiarcus sp.]|nr:hypothetical protein [Roseiarcus sp.]
MRHHGDEVARGRQARKIGERRPKIADPSFEVKDLLVRQFEKSFEQPQFAHEIERRWVDRVAAKVAQEVGVFLQDDDVEACPRQEVARHHSRRTAAGDAALRRYTGLGHGALLARRGDGLPHAAGALY